MGDIAQRGNRLTFAKGGRAGHALGHTAGRRLTKTLERLGGGPEGKPHSTRAGRIAAGVRKIKRGTKSWNKKDFKGSDEVRALLKGLRPKKPSTHGKDIPTMAAQGGRAGFFGGARVIKGAKLIKEHVAKKEAKKVQAGKDKIQKSEMGYAKGGRAGHALGHTAGRRLTERGAKSWNKKDITNKRISKDLVQDVFNVVARKHSLGQQGKPHSSKEGRTASFGRTVRDVKKILSPERDKNKKGGKVK